MGDRGKDTMQEQAPQSQQIALPSLDKLVLTSYIYEICISRRKAVSTLQVLHSLWCTQMGPSAWQAEEINAIKMGFTEKLNVDKL